MVTTEELEGFSPNRYLARSWALLTRDKGWIKPVLVATVALLVPVVGLLGCVGYVYEWARLTAWGVNAAPKQKGVRVGECICSGARVVAVILVWGLAAAIIGSALEWVPLLSLVWEFFTIFLAVVFSAAALRATIYQKFGAGFRADTLWQMVKHDPNGLLRVMGIGLLFLAISWSIGLMMSQFLAFSALLQASMSADIVEWGLRFLGSSLPLIVVTVLLAAFVAVLGTWLEVTALGLWMRQFNVPAWGRDEDPLPDLGPRASAVAPQPAYEPQPAPQQAPASEPQPAEQPAPTPDLAPESPVTPADPSDEDL